MIKLYIILTTTLTIKTNPFPKTPSTISAVRMGASTDFSVLDQYFSDSVILSEVFTEMNQNIILRNSFSNFIASTEIRKQLSIDIQKNYTSTFTL